LPHLTQLPRKDDNRTDTDNSWHKDVDKIVVLRFIWVAIFIIAAVTAMEGKKTNGRR